MEILCYLNASGELSSQLPDSWRPTDEQLVEAYKAMVMARSVDERMVVLQRQGTISFALTARGEEAAVVGAALALDKEDWIYPQYREMAALLFRGYPLQSYVNQMFGNSGDSAHGRQMPNHFGSRAHNVVTVSSPIGTKIPHAVGCAYGMKISGVKQVALAYFGEGASSEGDFHHAMNFAAVRAVPVLFFCRNNGYAISTPACQQYHGDGIAAYAAGYGIPALRVDGNDLFAVYGAVAEARQRALSEQRPMLIEAMSYRLGAHSTSDDPTQYRSQEEVASWELRCPLLRLRLYLIGRGLWSDSLESLLVDQLQEQISEAIQQAKQLPPPAAETLISEVYFSTPEILKQQLREVLSCQSST